jgi:hypothetical protein
MRKLLALVACARRQRSRKSGTGSVAADRDPSRFDAEFRSMLGVQVGLHGRDTRRRESVAMARSPRAWIFT